MNSLLRRVLVSSSSPAHPRRALLAALISPPPAGPPEPCRPPASQPLEPPIRRAFHSCPRPLGFRATTPAPWPGTVSEAGTAAGEDGLEVARLGISPRIVERLAARGITRLFPIQVAPFEQHDRSFSSKDSLNCVWLFVWKMGKAGSILTLYTGYLASYSIACKHGLIVVLVIRQQQIY